MQVLAQLRKHCLLDQHQRTNGRDQSKSVCAHKLHHETPILGNHVVSLSHDVRESTTEDGRERLAGGLDLAANFLGSRQSVFSLVKDYFTNLEGVRREVEWLVVGVRHRAVREAGEARASAGRGSGQKGA